MADYQGIGIGKRLLNFIAELYNSQTKIPFCILTSNPQITRARMENWRITRLGHACKGKESARVMLKRNTTLERLAVRRRIFRLLSQILICQA